MPAYQLEPCDANCSCKKRNKIKIKKLVIRERVFCSCHKDGRDGMPAEVCQLHYPKKGNAA